MERVLRWLKSIIYEEKKPEKVWVNIPMEPLEYKHQIHCKLHENYSGATEPVNNCNVCWEIYTQKKKSW